MIKCIAFTNWNDRFLTRGLSVLLSFCLLFASPIAFGKSGDPTTEATTAAAKTKSRWRGVSKAGVTVVVGGVTIGVLHRLGVDGALWGFVAGSLVGGFRAGPVAEVLKSASSWFLTPTTEFIRVANARYTGHLEQAINAFYDRHKGHPVDEAGPADANHRPKLANLARDGMNFAYMTPEDQAKNWDKNLRMWVAVAKRFGQLLRDTHHTGRVLMMISWSDEQGSTQLVEIMDSKLLGLNLATEQILAPFKTAFLMRGENAKKTALEEMMASYEGLCERTWAEPNLTPDELEKIYSDIETAEASLRDMGLSSQDLEKLREIQMARAKAVGTIVTALALNEIRSFNTAEANRNLEHEAREAQRVIRKGFHLQSYVERYLHLVQGQMQQMGYQNNGPSQPPYASTDGPCERLLRTPKGEAQRADP